MRPPQAGSHPPLLPLLMMLLGHSAPLPTGHLPCVAVCLSPPPLAPHCTALHCAADFATGKARQLVPDDHYKQTNQTLAEAYTRCANVRGAGWAGWAWGWRVGWAVDCARCDACMHPITLARSNVCILLPMPMWACMPGPCACVQAGRTSDKSKRRPYKHLRTPWGETFAFSREARKNISAATLARIHQLNALDEELWKIGEKLLEVGRF